MLSITCKTVPDISQEVANVSTPSLVLNFEDLLPITFNKRQRSQLTLVLLFVEEELECVYFRDTKVQRESVDGRFSKTAFKWLQ